MNAEKYVISVKEITEEIERLENSLFYLDMKDRWTTSDYEIDREWRNKLSELKRQLKKLENESEEN